MITGLFDGKLQAHRSDSNIRSRRTRFHFLMTARIISADDLGIEEAAKCVLAGGLVAYPTDTVYGLGCDPFQDVAVDRLIRVKQRHKGALPVLVDSMLVARRLGKFDKSSATLAGKFWPGPLTLVVPVQDQMPEPVTDGTSFIGLRMPKHETALFLIGECRGRVVGTSANISGHRSHRTAQEVFDELGSQIDLVLDGGLTPLGKESTVVKTLGKQVSVLREGAISQDEILMALKRG